jgi:hypothetical protein
METLARKYLFANHRRTETREQLQPSFTGLVRQHPAANYSPNQNPDSASIIGTPKAHAQHDSGHALTSIRHKTDKNLQAKKAPQSRGFSYLV